MRYNKKTVAQTIADKLRRYGIRKVLLAPEVAITVGKAQDSWKSWNLEQRRIILRLWCSTAQIRIFESQDWFQLSRHVRRSLKRHIKEATIAGKGVVIPKSGSSS